MVLIIHILFNLINTWWIFFLVVVKLKKCNILGQFLILYIFEIFTMVFELLELVCVCACVNTVRMQNLCKTMSVCPQPSFGSLLGKLEPGVCVSSKHATINRNDTAFSSKKIDKGVWLSCLVEWASVFWSVFSFNLLWGFRCRYIVTSILFWLLTFPGFHGVDWKMEWKFYFVSD